MYFSICYVSSSTVFIDAEIQELFDKTRITNVENNISGVFLHNSGNFLQYIEGSEAVVKSLYYDRISVDKRHKNPIVLFEKEIDYLYFDGYESGFSSVFGKEKMDKLSSYLTLLNHLDSKEAEAVTSTISSFLVK